MLVMSFKCAYFSFPKNAFGYMENIAKCFKQTVKAT